MSQKPETVFRQKFSRQLQQIPHSWWESIQQKSIHGTPDMLGCIRGFFVALEYKASKSSPITALQKHKLELIRQAGGIGEVVYPENSDEILEMLWSVSNGTNVTTLPRS